MGMTPIGEAHRGEVARGGEARFALALDHECVTLAAVGGEGVVDLDVALVDASARVLARDATHEPQATARACVDTAGAFTLVVTAAAGAGPFVASAWSGAAAAIERPDAASEAPAHANGTCEAPLPLVAGVTAGTTASGADKHTGTCGRGPAKELVYTLRTTGRTRVRATVTAQFDTVMYVRRARCDDPSGEVACNDDAPGGGSALDLSLDAGVYFLFVDALGRDAGPFRLSVDLAEVPAVAEVCRAARALTLGGGASGTTTGGFDNATATCGDGAPGLDVPFKLDVARRARVRVVERSDDFKPVVHLRRVCADAPSEVACADRGVAPEEAAFVGTLDPGQYAVFADGASRDAAGRFTLRTDTAPEQGSGVSGDGCGDAMPLAPPDKPNGDTFAARDDVAGSCGGAGAPDVVYRVDVARRARLTARVDAEEGRHVLVLTRACGDRGGEIACGPRIDEALAPGVYFLAVDGATASSFGRFALDVRARDVGAQEAACKSPALLVAGKTLSGTTVGGGDKFSTSCGGREDAPGGADRVYKIVLAQRSRVQISLATPAWDGVLAVRKGCVDASSSARAAELRCNNDTGDAHHSRVDLVLDPGTYWVVVDGVTPADEGAFTLEYKLLP